MQRLLVVAFATAVLILRQVVSWTDVDGNGVGYQGICESFEVCMGNAGLTGRAGSDGTRADRVFSVQARKSL